MMSKLAPTTNQLGRDVSAALPPAGDVVGVFDLPPAHQAVWERALPYLGVRDNDGHSIYAYGLARALVELHPQANPDVVLPGIILHDIGWSQVDPSEVLQAIEPGAGRPDLVIVHEKEGARLAREILTDLGDDPDVIDEIVAIIDGHDSRRTALSLNDSLLKDADKLWRLTPHGIDTVMDWFGLNREQAHRLIGSRVHDHLFTDAARTIALGLAAVASIDTTPQRRVLP